MMTWQDFPKKNVPVAKRKWNNGNKIFTKSLKYETVKFIPLDHVGQTNKGSSGGFSIYLFF